MDKEEKAKRLMYKRPALADMEYSIMYDELLEILDQCADISWIDDDTILSAIDYNEDLFEEYKMLFSDLYVACDRLTEKMNHSYVYGENNEFDDCAVALLGNSYKLAGFDTYEQDYFDLDPFDSEMAHTEARKRLARKTKSELISSIGQFVEIMLEYYDIKSEYNNLEAIFDFLRGENGEISKAIKRINELYEEIENGNRNAEKEFDRLVEILPDKVWVQ